ncbi:MAG: hypothetical protein H3C62_01330 [Gemmatimonadaceae bacterium]|nr:hypothetical protein [Gemmatimonadaceae bacterium]
MTAAETPVPATTVAAFGEAIALDAQILAVTRDLAYVQATNPDEQDGVGFSNSDYPTGFVLTAAGRVDECAALLLLYPRQAQERGLDLAVLRDRARLVPSRTSAEPPAIGERDLARSALRAARSRVAGRLHWMDVGDGELLLNGVGLSPVVRRALSGCVRTSTGWRLTATPELLHRFLQRLGPDGQAGVDRLDALKDLAGPVPASLRTIERPTEVVLSHRVVGTEAFLQWTLPFSDGGTALRARLKSFGARFDAASTQWRVPLTLLPTVAYAALLLPGIRLDDATTTVAETLGADDRLHAEDWLAALARGATVVGIKELPGGVLMHLSERRDDVYETLRRLGVSWKKDAQPPGYFVPLATLPAVAEALGKLPNLELGALTDRAFAIARELLDREVAGEAEIAALKDSLRVSPSGRELKPWQPEGIAHLVDPRWGSGRLLNFGVGTGKSLMGAVAAHLLTADDPAANVLVIAPAHLTHMWRDELLKWVGDREFIQVVDAKDAPVSRFCRWTICSYHMVVAQRERLERLGAKVLLLDEAQYIRNDTAAWTKCIVGDRKSSTRGLYESIPVVLPLTASEMKNRPRDVFNLLKVTRHPLGDNFFSFGQRYCDGHQIQAGRRVVWDFSGASNVAELGERLRPWMLRKTLDDVADLPPRLPPETVRFALSRDERVVYETGVRETLRAYKAGADALTAMTAAMRACALVTVPYTIRQAETALDAGIKLGIISRYPEVLTRMEQQFPGLTVRIDGSVQGGDAKHAAETEFQTNDAKRIVLLQTQATTGLTLTAGRHSILNDYPYTHEDIVQAEGRFRRIGTTGTVTSEWMHPEGTLADDLRALVDWKGATVEAFRAAVRGEGASDASARTMTSREVAEALLRRLGADVRAADAPAPHSHHNVPIRVTAASADVAIVGDAPSLGA